jgi:uncharacterized YigZ family protein
MAVFPDDQYQTIEKSAEASLRLKGSRFLGFGFPVETQEQFKQVLRERTKRYHDATHHCWAYRLLVNDKVVAASSDAGEPSGTAGKPILSYIEGRNLLNVGIIVTRYFGGTKLGTGGLARAYADCTQLTLNSASIVVKTITEQVILQFPYESISMIMRIVAKYGATVSASDFMPKLSMIINIPRSQVLHFKQELMDAGRGHIQFPDRIPH